MCLYIFECDILGYDDNDCFLNFFLNKDAIIMLKLTNCLLYSNENFVSPLIEAYVPSCQDCLLITHLI